MAKIVLPTIASTTDVSLINENFRKIAEDLNTKVMYRKNPVGESNTLDTNMDANGKQIYNLPAPTLEHQAARFGDIKGAIDAAGDAAEAALTALAASDLSTVASGVAVDAAADALDAVDDAEAFASSAAVSASAASGVLVDAAKKTELSAVSGMGLVGFDWAGLYASGTGGWALKTSENSVNILKYIPVSQWAAILSGASTADHSAFFASAKAAETSLFIPRGVFNLSTWDLPANSQIETSGFGTEIRQIAGLVGDIRMINIKGSNVSIGDLTVRGNIATDTGEQRHSIFARPDAISGNIDNIKIGNIRAFNVRGDAVYVGQPNGAAYKLTNISIGNVVVDNIYRNGVSIVSGDGVKISSVTGTRVGFCHVDIESNATSGPCINIDVGYIKGRTVGLIGTTPTDYVDAVKIGLLDLSPSNAGQSDPVYPFGVDIPDGLQVRNCRRIKIDHLRAEGFNRCAIFTTFNAGELGVELLEIGTLYMRNCSLTDTVYNAFVVAPNPSRLIIGHLDIELVQAGKSGFVSVVNSEIASIKGVLTNNTNRLLSSCSNFKIGTLAVTGGGRLLINCTKVIVKGGTYVGDYLAGTSNKCTFENLTVTATTSVFTSGSEDHTINNSTLNGDYYSFGTGIRNYLNTLRFGVYQIWVDATGIVRRKGGVPTSDLDGNALSLKVTVPATATSSGQPGQYAIGGGFRYDYTGDGTTHSWARATIAAW